MLISNREYTDLFVVLLKVYLNTIAAYKNPSKVGSTTYKPRTAQAPSPQ
jgi:hypothetical protein